MFINWGGCLVFTGMRCEMVKKNEKGYYGHGVQLTEDQERQLNTLRDKYSIPQILMAGIVALTVEEE